MSISVMRLLVSTLSMLVSTLLGLPSSNAIFASHRFSKLLTELRNHYDYILIDSPPVLSVPDARLIGANSDVSIYILKYILSSPYFL